jgi:replication factor A1
MGVIEDVYEDLDADVDFEDFEAAVHDKVEQMGGLADEETAAMLVAHEYDDAGGEVETVADIEPGMEEVKFLAKVVSVGEVRTFERDGDDPDGRVANVEVADASGRVRVSFWDEMADAVEEGQLEVGQVLRIAGRPKEGYNGVEVSVDKAEPDEDAAVDVQVLDEYRVEDLALGLSDVNLRGRILDTDSVRTFSRDDGSEGRVANLVLGDETGRVRVTLWDQKADLADEFDPGQSVEVVDGYVRERDGDLELHVGDRGAVEELDEPVEYVPETTDIASLELGDTVDVAGAVIETSDKRTFSRDDGSEGQVRNVRLKDDTGDIRVAMWGDKADLDVDLADYVVVTDAEIQDGWQDDLEASAGWRSAVSVLDDAPDGDDVEAAADDDAPQGETGLGAFGGDSASSTDGAAANGTDPDRAEDAPADGETVEFTGTVVQAGDPVVLDDGSQTRSVETDANLRLGEEVTVRGRLSGDRLHADEVF